jgi:hypothetical protein
MSTELATYADHGWNLNNLPLLPGSVLHYIGGSVTGITTPWMYIGMVFSSFCWYHPKPGLLVGLVCPYVIVNVV